MNTEAINSMMNPVRIKIIRELTIKSTATTKEIQEILPDIPQATLYRHLQHLLKNGIIEIVSENKVRGILEKVYSMKSNPSMEINQNLDQLTKADLSQLFSQFVISLLSDMGHFLNNDAPLKMREAPVGFISNSAYLSDQELVKVLSEIREIIQNNMNFPASPERKLRKLTTIHTTTLNIKEE